MRWSCREDFSQASPEAFVIGVFAQILPAGSALDRFSTHLTLRFTLKDQEFDLIHG
jgi:hypothetical protein